MTAKLKWSLGLLAIVLLVPSWLGFRVYQEIGKRNSEDPLVWDKDIVAFEAAAEVAPPPENAVVFVGSSSIRLWDSLVEDMAPIPVIQRGFGGAKLNDLVHYAERLVNVYQPAAVVVFAGSNDITPVSVKTPKQLLASYQEFIAIVRAHHAKLPVYYIAITPSPRRWQVWPNARAVNVAIEEYCNSSPGLFFIDTGQALMNAQGEPEKENYMFDGQHLSEQGYSVWASIIRARLLADLSRD